MNFQTIGTMHLAVF